MLPPSSGLTCRSTRRHKKDRRVAMFSADVSITFSVSFIRGSRLLPSVVEVDACSDFYRLAAPESFSTTQ